MTSYRLETVECPDCRQLQTCNILTSWSSWGQIHYWSDGYSSEGGFTVSTPYVSCAACRGLFLPYQNIVRGIPEPQSQNREPTRLWELRRTIARLEGDEFDDPEPEEEIKAAWPPSLDQIREALADSADGLESALETHLRTLVFMNDCAPDREGSYPFRPYPENESVDAVSRADSRALNEKMKLVGNAERLVELLQAMARPNPFLLGQALKHLGRFDEAAAAYRHHMPIHHPWRAPLVSMAEQRDALVVELPDADFRLPFNIDRIRRDMTNNRSEDSGTPTFKINYEHLDEQVRTTGELVAYQDWDSGETGAGAGRLSVYRYKDQFYSDGDVGIEGPYETFERAADGSGVLRQTDATVDKWVAAEYEYQR